MASPARRPVVLPNCIDLPPGGREPGANLILFAGRVVSDKGADVFVQACARVLPLLPGWRAEMVGADRFRPCTGDPVRARAAPLAEAAGVVMRGHQPNAEVLAGMQRAAMVVMPTLARAVTAWWRWRPWPAAPP